MTEYDFLIGKLCKDDRGMFFIIDVQPITKLERKKYSASAGVQVFWIDPERMTKVEFFIHSKSIIKQFNIIG